MLYNAECKMSAVMLDSSNAFDDQIDKVLVQWSTAFLKEWDEFYLFSELEKVIHALTFSQIHYFSSELQSSLTSSTHSKF